MFGASFIGGSIIYPCSLCAGVENYSPGGVHLLIGDLTPLPHGPHPPGYAETLTKQQLLAQSICACRVRALERTTLL